MLHEEASSEQLFFSPNKNNFTEKVEEVGSNEKMVAARVSGSKNTKAVQERDNLRATDGFGDFEEMPSTKIKGK